MPFLLISLYCLTFRKKWTTAIKYVYVRKVFNMKEILLFLGIIAIWYILQAYILPKMGIST